MKVSIIICTLNRADDLRETLKSMQTLCIPSGISAELIVVDNGSTDKTQEVVAACRIPGIATRCVVESRKGLSYGRNRGLQEAGGDIILFTDDDVRVCPDWIEGMCAPFISQQAHLVAGGVALAPHLLRPWMESTHKGFLAATDTLAQEAKPRATGANMAFSREILSRVPGFDVELGAGTPLGFGEETLFSSQVVQAGYKFAYALDAKLEHHFPESRLARSCFEGHACRMGRTNAYVAYHWEHLQIERIRQKLLKRMARLMLERRKHRNEVQPKEGMSVWEIVMLSEVHYLKQFLEESRRPRNYEPFGLVKRQGILP